MNRRMSTPFPHHLTAGQGRSDKKSSTATCTCGFHRVFLFTPRSPLTRFATHHGAEFSREGPVFGVLTDQLAGSFQELMQELRAIRGELALLRSAVESSSGKPALRPVPNKKRVV